MEQPLPEPSPKLQALLEQERVKPEYAEMDPDLATLHVLETVHKTHGDGIFDFTNPTDDILRQILTNEGLA